VAGVRDVLDAAKITVKKASGPEVIRVKGNREMLREAFARVLQNAIDFAREGTEIRVTSKVLSLFELLQRPSAAVISSRIPTDVDAELLDSTHYVEVEFKDTGKGIPDEDLSKVLTPFYSTKVKGIGLGLAIVEKTLQQHSGRLELDSKEGAGTAVRLILPAYREE
jgi:signal transduction histidine kinase